MSQKDPKGSQVQSEIDIKKQVHENDEKNEINEIPGPENVSIL